MLHTVLFYILAVITGACAVAVVVTQNIVRAAAWLLFALGGAAGIFFLLGADFVGATQLLVYVGGTLVLVVFGVMLTAQGPFISMGIGAAEWVIALGVGLALYAVLAVSLLSRPEAAAQTPVALPVLGASTLGLLVSPSGQGPLLAASALIPGRAREMPSSVVLGEALLGAPQAVPAESLTGIPPGRTAGPRQTVTYLLPFEIVSVHLLVVLIGAAYLARAKKKGVVSRG